LVLTRSAPAAIALPGQQLPQMFANARDMLAGNEIPLNHQTDTTLSRIDGRTTTGLSALD